MFYRTRKVIAKFFWRLGDIIAPPHVPFTEEEIAAFADIVQGFEDNLHLAKDIHANHVGGVKWNPGDEKAPDNVVPFGGVTRLPIDPEFVLDGAKDILKTVVIVGFRAEDDSFYFASSDPDGGTVMWLFEVAKHKLMTET